jgi:hypothetical protein
MFPQTGPDVLRLACLATRYKGVNEAVDYIFNTNQGQRHPFIGYSRREDGSVIQLCLICDQGQELHEGFEDEATPQFAKNELQALMNELEAGQPQDLIASSSSGLNSRRDVGMLIRDRSSKLSNKLLMQNQSNEEETYCTICCENPIVPPGQPCLSQDDTTVEFPCKHRFC